MTEAFITVGRGGPTAENDIPDATYPLILTAISDPRPVEATRGPNAGKTINLIDWTWAIDKPGHPLDAREITSSTSDRSGPKSKMFAYLTALMGGVAPAPDTKFAKTDLVGRRVYGTINHDEEGWNRLGALVAIPPDDVQRAFVQATGLPQQVQPPVAAVAQPVGAAPAAGDDLPF